MSGRKEVVFKGMLLASDAVVLLQFIQPAEQGFAVTLQIGAEKARRRPAFVFGQSAVASEQD